MDTRTNSTPGLLVLSAQDIATLLTPRDCLEAVTQAYRGLHADPSSASRALEFRVEGGSFHLKAGLYPQKRDVLAAKLNANFPGNPARGLPTVQGLLLLSDAIDGQPLALIVGCGRQAAYQLPALVDALAMDTVHLHDAEGRKAEDLARRHAGRPDTRILPATDLAAATRASAVIVLCTTATAPVLLPGMVAPGAFVAAVGADTASKQEIAPDLFRGVRILVDDLTGCLAHGDLSHAIAAGTLAADLPTASLAQLAAGAAVGRHSAQEIVVYDSVGAAVQDVAVGKLACAQAVEQSRGVTIQMS